MSKVCYQGQEFERKEEESVLQTLLRNDVPAPHACGVGICQSCMMRCTKGDLPPNAQLGLKATLRAENYFLPCLCYSTEPIEIEDADVSGRTVDATILSQDWLAHETLRLTLQTEVPFSYRAGQFISLKNPNNLIRSYSLASVPALDEPLQLHIRLHPQGAMSTWFRDHATLGTKVQVQGPLGECFYLPEDLERPLLLAGTGTGLAPLFGILRDALHNGHQGPIRLYHGALHAEGLYLVQELQELASQHENFTYIRCLRAGDPEEGVAIGDITQIIKSQLQDSALQRAYLCGDPTLIKHLKKQLFLAGVPLKSIYSDPFLPAL
ncbi:MAG: 2Fe-2S iron-sulfur cluster binding domain-containing protein [Myxococcales bacterium]|nr:2Fe-2S iron-sulfur cluster binding domain-containing protein [Myxococcales bacterium]